MGDNQGAAGGLRQRPLVVAEPGAVFEPSVDDVLEVVGRGQVRAAPEAGEDDVVGHEPPNIIRLTHCSLPVPWQCGQGVVSR